MITKILFVCMGNICRSPTAEGIMRDLIKKEGLEDYIHIDSAGTSSWHEGDLPDSRSIECAKRHGVDLTDLRSRPLKAEDFAEFHLILVMDDINVADVNMKRPYEDGRYSKAKVKKILEYAPSWGKNVPDPYYNDGFDRVFEMLEAACKNLLNEIKMKI